MADFKIWPLFVAAIISLAAIWVNHERYVLSQKAHEQHRQIEYEKEKLRHLRARLSELQSPSRLLRVAEKLHMHPPHAGQLIKGEKRE